MTSNKYISIKSVLHDLINTIDERYWNEAKMLEWATKGFRKLRLIGSLVDKIAVLDVCAHKATLPSDFMYLTQIAYKSASTTQDPEITLPSNSGLANTLTAWPIYMPWSPMRLTSNPYFGSICLDDSLLACADCLHEFSVDENLILTTTVHTGTIMVAYMGYPTNDKGDALIIDNENLKDALLHYVLYRYWMSKYQMKEEGAQQHMSFHLDMWNTLASKAAGDVNMPDVNTLENIKIMRDRLVPSNNRFQQLFLTFGGRQDVNF